MFLKHKVVYYEQVKTRGISLYEMLIMELCWIVLLIIELTWFEFQARADTFLGKCFDSDISVHLENSVIELKVKLQYIHSHEVLYE